MEISVRLEGGLGDCLLAHRFIPAIKEKYPDCRITGFIDSEGKTFQKEALDLFYPNEYKELVIIPSKNYKELLVKSQFGEKDSFYGALENVPTSYLERMRNFDKFYDLHIDGLKFTKYDFKWLKYFYNFPTPKVNIPDKTDDYFLLHLASNNLGNQHRMAEWYIVGLVKRLAAKIHCKVILTDTTKDYLKCLDGIKNVSTIEQDLKELTGTIANANAFIGIDSGLKYIAYSLGVPVICYSAQAYEPHRVYPSHKIRWLIYENDCVPLHYDAVKVANIAHGIVQNKGTAIIPSVGNEFDRYAINRIYTVNEESSIRN